MDEFSISTIVFEGPGPHFIGTNLPDVIEFRARWNPDAKEFRATLWASAVKVDTSYVEETGKFHCFGGMQYPQLKETVVDLVRKYGEKLKANPKQDVAGKVKRGDTQPQK